MKIVFPEYQNATIKQALMVQQTMIKNQIPLNLGNSQLPPTPIQALSAANLDEACQMVKNGQADSLIAGIELSSRDVILACKKHFGMQVLPPQIAKPVEPSIDKVLSSLPELELDQPNNLSITSKFKQKFFNKNTTRKKSAPEPAHTTSPQTTTQDPDQDLIEKSAYHIPGVTPATPQNPPAPTLPNDSQPALTTLTPKNPPLASQQIETYKTFSGLAVMQRNDETYLLADMAACKHPNATQLTEIIWQTYSSARKILQTEPRIALLSFSTHGSGGRDDTIELWQTVLAQFKNSGLLIDGEMQLDAAVVPEIGQTKFPGSQVAGQANVLIAPDLNSGNLLYKSFERIGNFTIAGPILQGFNYQISDLSRGSSVADILLTMETLVRLCQK